MSYMCGNKINTYDYLYTAGTDTALKYASV